MADTSLLETAPNNNLGGQTFLSAGTTQNNTRTRGLVRFDFGGQIPINSTISSVTLTVEVTRQPVDGYAISTFSLHPILQSWGEGNKIAADPRSPGQGAPATAGEATWAARFAGTSLNWSVPGGAPGVDFVAAASAFQVVYDVTSSPYVFASTPALVGDVQAWVNDGPNNFGWMLMSDSEATSFTARRFGSHEDPARAPLLTVAFTPVPEPGSLALLGIGIGLLSRHFRKHCA